MDESFKKITSVFTKILSIHIHPFYEMKISLKVFGGTEFRFCHFIRFLITYDKVGTLATHIFIH